MGLFSDLLGTLNNFFRIGLTGVRLKNVSGHLAVRNSGDTADAEITASEVKISGNRLVINSDAVGSGSDYLYVLQRPASTAAVVTLTLPADDGSPGQALITDGNGILSWISAAGTADKETVDTTSLAFNSTATVAMFTLPANSIVHYVEVIIDTPFNGTPSLSVGISGNASKYLGSSSVDLSGAAKDRYRVHPGEPASGSAENLQIAYSQGGATAGAARVLVGYSVPS